MRYARADIAAARGTTLVELTVATAIMTTVFAAILPLFVTLRNSTQVRRARLEMLQNARVLNEHLSRHLAQARRIVAVSPSTEGKGYLEFEAPDGGAYRYAVGARGYVAFGPVGKLCELAGPVEYLRFVCYGGADFERPRPASAGVGLVTWEAGLKSPDPLAHSRPVRGACCLRTDPGK
jgi:hypothetical protein